MAANAVMMGKTGAVTVPAPTIDPTVDPRTATFKTHAPWVVLVWMLRCQTGPRTGAVR